MPPMDLLVSLSAASTPVCPRLFLLASDSYSKTNTLQVTPQQQSTFFDNAQSSLDSPLFAAYLPNQADGAYDFGYIDSSKYTGSIVYADVDSSNGFWEYPSTSYKIGSKTYSQSGRTGISDTGTTLILMGDTAVDKYVSLFPLLKISYMLALFQL
jgi:aspergillopepsin I